MTKLMRSSFVVKLRKTEVLTGLSTGPFAGTIDAAEDVSGDTDADDEDDDDDVDEDKDANDEGESIAIPLASSVSGPGKTVATEQVTSRGPAKSANERKYKPRALSLEGNEGSSFTSMYFASWKCLSQL